MEHRTVITTSEGKEAIIYLEDEFIEDSAKTQLLQIMSNDSVSNIRLQPDTHCGHGCLVGFTAKIKIDKVNPNFISGDIGCGIMTYPIGNKKIDTYKVEEKIKKLIPMGNENKTGCYKEIPYELSYLERYLEQANIKLKEFYEKFSDDINKIKEETKEEIVIPEINLDYLDNLCKKIKINIESCMKSLGTLGGGNHFIEINIDEETNEKYVTVHSGSRNFGMKLFHYHCMYINPVHKCLIDKHSLDYINDMILAQELASMNRHIMLELILREINVEFDKTLIIESVHNYIDFNRMILRKGAISSEKNEQCILALNMRDGILLCTGLGNEDWNYSCAHGCGRLMTRNQARRSISIKNFKKSMKDVVSSSINKETLDEAPQAYKDYNIIIEAINEKTVIINKILKPIINWKG